DVDGRAGQGPSADLVEARAAIDGPVVARRERDNGLTPAGPANRGVELARAFAGAGSFGNGSARWASLGVVGQPLRGKERLLAVKPPKYRNSLRGTGVSRTTSGRHASAHAPALVARACADARGLQRCGNRADGDAAPDRSAVECAD